MIMADTIEIELYGGPGDGMNITVARGTEVWVMTQPQMTPAEFIALESGQPYAESVLPAVQHVYLPTRTRARRSLRLIFRYAGPKKPQ